MFFFQGSWYCSQCGAVSDTHQTGCHLCKGDEFQTEPYAPIDDNDQLTDDKQKYLDYNVGNF